MNDPELEDMRNNISSKAVLIVAIIYFLVVIYTFGLAIIPLIVIWSISYTISSKEIKSLTESSTNFKKTYPLQKFGVAYGEFNHVYYHDTDLEIKIFRRIEGDVRDKTPISSIKPIKIVDIDPFLRHTEGRDFLIATSMPTLRGTKVSLALRFAKFGKMQTVQWWALAAGYIDKNKRFLFVAFSPFTIWFWIIPYLRREYDVISQIRTVYSSAYNNFDIQIQVKCIHEAVFNALIEELDLHDIDTSTLRVQKIQMMSINIAGGNANIGNIVQGSMNKIIPSSKGTLA